MDVSERSGQRQSAWQIEIRRQERHKGIRESHGRRERRELVGSDDFKRPRKSSVKIGPGPGLLG